MHIGEVFMEEEQKDLVGKYLKGNFKRLVESKFPDWGELKEVCDTGNLEGVRQLLPSDSNNSIIKVLRVVLDDTVRGFAKQLTS